MAEFFLLNAPLKEEINLIIIFLNFVNVSVFKLCAEILRREIEHYNAHSNNTKKQTKTHRQIRDSNSRPKAPQSDALTSKPSSYL